MPFAAMSTRFRGSHRRDGFTIIEFLIVVVILGVVMAITATAFRKQQRFVTKTTSLVGVRAQMRQAAAVLPAELAVVEVPAHDVMLRAGGGIASTVRATAAASVRRRARREPHQHDDSHDPERRQEARHRRADAPRGRIEVLDEIDPPARPGREEPLVEREPGDPDDPTRQPNGRRPDEELLDGEPSARSCLLCTHL